MLIPCIPQIFVSFTVDAMLAKEVMSFLKDFKESRESEKNQDGGHNDSDPDDLTYSGTEYSPSSSEHLERKEPQKRPRAITFVDEVF